MDDKAVLRGLKNIGSTIADRLEAVGLKTVADLQRIGPAQAFNLIKEAHPDITIPVCYYLYSLQGALEGKHWDALAQSTKNRLLHEAGIERPTRRSSGRGKQTSRRLASSLSSQSKTKIAGSIKSQ